MIVPFEKITSLPTLVLGSPVQLVVAERKSEGAQGGELGWECSCFQLAVGIFPFLC